jgi:hypothetical protein
MADLNEMGRRIVLILVFGMLSSFAASATAFAQAGSTGGTIGKTDKSISGEENAVQPRTPTKFRSRRQRPIDRGASGRASVGAGHREEKEIREAPGSSREVRPSSEAAKTTINNTPTCSRAYAGCVRARSRFGKGIVRNCESNFAKCKQTGVWDDSYSHFEGLARR